ncbi:hypothetical protein ACEK06_02575 [Pseudomonas brenneri]|uniref:hypothetical protein n=1 Tax=Pseudomonas brenneri TaxID=129817 RepID=UPI0035714297
MSTDKNSPLQSANINVIIDGQNFNFSPTQFSGTPAEVRMDTGISTHLIINYGKSLAAGTHTLTHTQFKIEFLDDAGRKFTHPVAGTIVVKVLGNTHTGTLTGVKVDGTGSGAGSQVELSGTYSIVIS